jgi:hypothetical protein
VRDLLRQPVKAIAQTDGEHCGSDKKARHYFLFNADSLDSGSGSGRVGNNKSVKSVVSGHFELLLLPALFASGRRSASKGTNSPKAICANYGKVVLFLNLLEDLQRVD